MNLLKILYLFTRRWAILLLLLSGSSMLFVGCKTLPAAYSEKAAEFNLPSYRSFAFAEIPQEIEGSEPGLILRIRDNLKMAAERSFQELSYTLVEKETADFWVRVTGRINPQVEVRDYGFQHRHIANDRWSRYYPDYITVPEVRNYEEAVLIVEVYEPNEDTLVWVGWSRPMHPSFLSDATTLFETIDQIVKEFPAKL